MFTSVQIKNYRSISDTGLLPLGPITVVIGRNNTGKSALLRGIYSLQDGSTLQQTDIRLGETQMSIALVFDRLPEQFADHSLDSRPAGVIALTYGGHNNRSVQLGIFSPEGELTSTQINVPMQDPYNLFIPVLSGRRQSYYREQATATNTFSITPQDSFLVSRIMPFTSGQFPEAAAFRTLCDQILGIKFDVYPIDQQQQIGVQVSRRGAIPLEAMGAGLSGALSLIFGLSTATGKLFVIEEPEDDLHPKALKSLLDAIVEASAQNQFIVSTHSSIVLTRLGALPSTQILHVQSDGNLLPTSSYQVVTDRSERLAVLQDLGYSLADLDLGEGWLIFEESSAERLVREYLVRWFAPGLRSLRTVAARGNGRVEPLFESYREMLLYAHLEPAYRHRAWVIVDGDTQGIELVDRLTRDFSTWPAGHFRTWSKPSFEHYYPAEFSDRAGDVLAIKDRDERRAAKIRLLQDVIAWVAVDEDRAKIEFAKSAADVIAVLQAIEVDVVRRGPILQGGVESTGEGVQTV